MPKFISDEDMAKLDASIPQVNRGKFISDDDMSKLESEVDPKTSQVTAATTGLIRGAVPFAAPIAGAGRAAMDAITGTRGPLAGGSLDDIADDYRDARDQFKGDTESAAKANPKTAFASTLAGGIANPLFKGADSLPKVMGAGAVQALGDSSADLTKGELKGAAIDTGIGAGAGALGYAAGKAIPAVVQGAGWAGKKFLTTLGPTQEAIKARLAGKAQSTAASYPALAEKMGGTLGKLQGQIKAAGDAAAETLSSEPSIPKPYVTNAIDEGLASLGIKGDGKKVLIGQADKRASAILNEIKSDINALTEPKKLPPVPNESPVYNSPEEAFSALSNPKTEVAEKVLPPRDLSQKDLKLLIQKLDDNINWDDQSADKLNNVLKGLRNEFDSTLKFQNPAYKKAMVPVSVKMRILDNTKKQFNFKNIPDEGLAPTDTTASKLQHSMSENKFMTQKNLGLLERHTGDDYLAGAKDYQLAKQFENTAANGSKRTALGAGLGYMIGHGSPLAVGAGTAIGSTMDHYGGKVVGGLLDGIVRAGNSKVLGQFAPIIEQASKRGPEALAVTASMLSQNPEFRKILQSINPDIPESPVRKLGSVGGRNE